MRTPCPDSHLAARNAKVLSPKSQINRDTEFYQRVRQFRNERAEKNQTSEVSVKLYIPGQIIHLVDTMGDETKYVPYWASRYEFNQVILSSRMLADHSIPPLVEILRNLSLDDVHEVHAWHNLKEEEDGSEDDGILAFMPFSNPQGRFPLLLIFLAVAGCVVASLANQMCKYVTRSAMVYDPVTQSTTPGQGLSAGLWSYNLKQCIDPDDCDIINPSDLEDSKYCQQYGRLFDNIDVYWRAARAFGSISALLGLMSIGIISFSSCTKLKKRTWVGVSANQMCMLVVCGLFGMEHHHELFTMIWTSAKVLFLTSRLYFY